MVKGVTSSDRRKDIISAAVEIFAELGYYRATTAQVAERAAISQPYVYRFFTKESLLVAALEVSWQRILETFGQVKMTSSADRLEEGFIRAYEAVMQSHRNEILLQMQAQTIQEPPIRAAMRKGMEDVKQFVLQAFQEAGMEQAEERTSNFLARGMLCNVSLALDMPDLMLKK
ncbi:TetR/AcrR family transcriptional regulator [Paenibacillus sp. GCM10023248]|uniref:TetR/AcrR family transcriptional regulator n=1 Tax=Bacillales TaxID=1385 RepID=UPI0023790D20|nr:MULTISPECIES: TetR/AcrR family transcriptional regulator [Bacillales]MDD9267036.1 TetR/AcrR family transcriptional regulator [Paenibacillus sp. MAHUQ-63]MDR6881237.1 AcrR family transcriptional regulator [Bacillus sp. 3255]